LSYFTRNTPFNACPEFEILIPVLQELEKKREELWLASSSTQASSCDKEKFHLIDRLLTNVLKPLDTFNETPANQLNNQTLINLMETLNQLVGPFLKTHYAKLNAPRNGKKEFGNQMFTYYKVFQTGVNYGAGCSIPSLIFSYTFTHFVTQFLSNCTGLGDPRSATVQLLCELTAGFAWILKCLTQPDYYAVLGLSANAAPSDAEIKKAYHKHILVSHSDKTHNIQTEEISKLLNEAKAVLTDPEKRKAHDEFLALKRNHFKSVSPSERVAKTTLQLTI
jgi:hypothetical protein